MIVPILKAQRQFESFRVPTFFFSFVVSLCPLKELCMWVCGVLYYSGIIIYSPLSRPGVIAGGQLQDKGTKDETIGLSQVTYTMYLHIL